MSTKKSPVPATAAPEGSPFQFFDPRMRRVALIIGGMIIAAGVLAALVLVWPVIRALVVTSLPFVVGLVFAYIFNPVVNFVQHQLRLSRVGGVLILYLVFILALTAFFAMVLPILIQQVRSAYHGISDFVVKQSHRVGDLLGISAGEGATVDYGLLIERLNAWLLEHGIIIEDVFRSDRVQSAARSAATSGMAVVGDALSFFFTIIIGLVGSVMFIVFAVLVNIYLLIDFSKIRGVMEVMVPKNYQPRFFDVMNKLDIAVGGFIRGSLTVAFIVGCIAFLGLYMLGLREYALLIAIIAGLGNLVPYLGPICGATPAVLYVLMSDSYETMQQRLFYLAGVLGLFGLIQFIEGFILQPKIVGKSASLHPLAVLFALALGANFGILGMMLAVPAACIARVLLKEFYWDAQEADWQKRTGKKRLEDASLPARRKKRQPAKA